jgi:hypothetical protein
VYSLAYNRYATSDSEHTWTNQSCIDLGEFPDTSGVAVVNQVSTECMIERNDALVGIQGTVVRRKSVAGGPISNYTRRSTWPSWVLESVNGIGQEQVHTQYNRFGDTISRVHAELLLI